MHPPQDWETWRVYADQLLDRGDVRGQLIGLEHELATGRVPADKRLATMQKARILESAWRDRWLEGWPVPGTPDVKWRMGFVTEVTMTWGPGTLAILQALRAHPTACFLTRLKLQTRFAPEVGDVLGSEVFQGLTHLELELTRLGDEGVRTLAQSDALGELTSLGLLHNEIGDEGAIVLAQSSALPALTSLNLRGNKLGHAGRAALQALTRRGCQVTS
jgi:hypothetical protein